MHKSKVRYFPWQLIHMFTRNKDLFSKLKNIILDKNLSTLRTNPYFIKFGPSYGGIRYQYTHMLRRNKVYINCGFYRIQNMYIWTMNANIFKHQPYPYLILTPMDFLKACVSASVLLISREKISLPAILVNGVSVPRAWAIPTNITISFYQRPMVFNQKGWKTALTLFRNYKNFLTWKRSNSHANLKYPKGCL